MYRVETPKYATDLLWDRTEALARRLYPQRSWVLATGLAVFLAAAFPLVRVATAGQPLASWHPLLFGASIPIVLWAFALTLLATYFHPQLGLVGSARKKSPAEPAWLERFLRAYAVVSVVAFAVAPFAVVAAVASHAV